MAGCDENGLKVEALHFGGDSSYSAYIVDENAGIPERYKLQAAFEKWLKIYDDNELTFEATADRINVFRCGDYGCIIQLLFL